MGLLWRLFAPKPLKKARRSVRKVTHPVRTVERAVTPKSVKNLQRAARPLSLAELKTEDAIVSVLRGERRQARRQRQGEKEIERTRRFSGRVTDHVVSERGAVSFTVYGDEGKLEIETADGADRKLRELCNGDLVRLTFTHDGRQIEDVEVGHRSWPQPKSAD